MSGYISCNAPNLGWVWANARKSKVFCPSGSGATSPSRLPTFHIQHALIGPAQNIAAMAGFLVRWLLAAPSVMQRRHQWKARAAFTGMCTDLLFKKSTCAPRPRGAASMRPAGIDPGRMRRCVQRSQLGCSGWWDPPSGSAGRFGGGKGSAAAAPRAALGAWTTARRRGAGP